MRNGLSGVSAFWYCIQPITSKRGGGVTLRASSAYNQGMMGYKTPNIDRIAREGALFTDWYGEQSAGHDRRPPADRVCGLGPPE